MFNQSINYQPTNKPIHPSIHQPISQSVINQSARQLVSQSINQSASQSVSQSINQSMNQTVLSATVFPCMNHLTLPLLILWKDDLRKLDIALWRRSSQVLHTLYKLRYDEMPYNM